ncbi:MAG: hypothetical protein NW217_08065 [Hyphomicrobiaceae bacterium]|nr:hypothetical protein [Hyphomicrobiaceae bacterium]
MAPRDFQNPAMTKEAREAISSAFDALSKWRDDMASANEQYSKTFFDQMAQATRSMGWPDHVIEATRTQLNQASKMQLQMMDQLMETWETQLKSPSAGLTSPQEFMEQLQKMQPPGMAGMPGMSGFPGMGSMPGMGAGGMPGMAMAPFQIWMQAAEAWQKNMASAMSMWTGDGKSGGKK